MTDRTAVLPMGNDKPRRRWRRWLFGFVVFNFVGWWLSAYLFALFATQAHPSMVPDWTELDGFALESVEVVAVDGVHTRGWLLGPSRDRVVVLAAGIRGNRTAMVQRARWHASRGWSALVVDLRGTGESEPERLSMGWHEALDLVAWRAMLRQRGFRTVGVHAVSLGAAAASYADQRDPDGGLWDFLVLESCYSNLLATLMDRIPGVPAFAFWPLLTCSGWVLGLDTDDLDPVRALAKMSEPTMIVCGADDQKVGEGATEALYAACEGRKRAKFLVPGVGHHDLWPHDTAALQGAIAAFVDGL
ncbi:MAG: alpha/beta hydrolase [Planctomycetota bacterium]